MKEQKDMLEANIASAAKDLLKYWYFPAIFSIAFLLIAYFYLGVATRTYQANASIVINIENNNNFTRGGGDLFGALDFMAQERSFQNEIFYMQSLPLVREVIGDMDVRVSYFEQDSKIPARFTFGLQDIYKNSPFIVIPDEGNSQPVSILFKIDILNENRFYISASDSDVSLVDPRTERITGRVADFSLSGIYDFGATVSNEHTSFRIVLNSGYNSSAQIGKDLFFMFNNLNTVANSYKNALTVEAQGRESTLAHIEFKNGNSNLGLDFLNKLIEIYIERNMDEANLLASKTIEYIENQLEDVSGDLNLSERQLQNLRLNRNVMDIQDKSRSIYEQIQVLEERRNETNRRLNHLRQMDDYFTQFKDSTKILAPSALGLNDPMLNGLIEELTTLNSEKQRIISQDQMRNPRLATLNIRIDNLKDVIAENISFSLATTRSEIQDMNNRIASLNNEFAVLPGAQREMIDIERRFNLNDATYTSLLEKRIQAQITKAAKLPDAKIIEPPRYSGLAGPNSIIFYFLSLILGVGLPSLIIMGKKLIVNRIISKEDVKFITDISIIGSIPSGKSVEKSILNNPQSIIAESFYTLRSNLVYYLHGDDSKVILVTSSIPGEGKSFTSLNLATSFAFSNHKTILVEFDLRKPSEVMSGFNTEKIPGVSSYLINRAKLEEIIIKTEEPNLDIIQAGQIPPNPIALISSPKTRELINQLKEKYDFIILDTPPYGLLTDSFMLMNYADLNLFVTRLNYTRKTPLATSMEDIEKKGLNNMYLLVNGENNEMFSYGYGKYPYLKKKKRLTK